MCPTFLLSNELHFTLSVEVSFGHAMFSGISLTVRFSAPHVISFRMAFANEEIVVDGDLHASVLVTARV